MRIVLPFIAASLLVACSGGGDSDGNTITIKSAELGCDKQKIDVAESVRATCDGKTTCTCDEACWTKGAFPVGCKENSFNIVYDAAGGYHAHYSSSVKPGQVLVIKEDGKVDFKFPQ